MRYRTQSIAYYFFASCMVLFSLQLVYGFILGFARMGFDPLHELIPFNTARATHTNLLVVWLLAGFMGAAYYIIPEESERELWQPKLAWIQLVSLLVVGVVAIAGYHMNWWEGRKFLEIPRELDWLVVVNVLTFLLVIFMTIWTGARKTTTAMVLFFGLLFAALLYLPGMITFDNLVEVQCRNNLSTTFRAAGYDKPMVISAAQLNKRKVEAISWSRPSAHRRTEAGRHGGRAGNRNDENL